MWAFLLFFALIFGLIGLSEFLQGRGVLSEEGTRKLVHIGVGALILTAPLFFRTGGPVMVLSALFILINAWALWKGAFRGMHAVERQTLGTVLYPLAVLLLTALFWNRRPLYFTALSALFFGDAVAAVVGQKWPLLRFQVQEAEKSLGGSLSFFLTTLLVGLVAYRFGGENLSFAALAGAALMGTLAEAVVSGGFDNLTAPLWTALWLHFFEKGLPPVPFFIACGVALLIALPSVYLRFLTPDGGILTFLLGSHLLALGGWKWIFPILTFFLSSSLLTQIARRRSRVKPGEARDGYQVLANGGVPLLLVVIHALTGWDLFLLYLTAVAVSTSDTWATEIGVFSPSNPRRIIGFQIVPKGSSGGVSWIGTLGGLAGAALIGVFSLLYGYGLPAFFLVLGLGMLGNFLDSVLGATLEVQYRCEVCGGIYDVPVHCGRPAVKLWGFRWFENNWVNFTSSLVATLLGVVVFL